MSQINRRPVPSSIWWLLITAAYSWGYAEGRRAGSLEGYARATKTWVDAYKWRR